MGFLHKLWDETLAGPAPDTGLGKLRKYDSFSAKRSPSMVANEVPITRSITILRTKSTFRNLLVDPGSASESPAVPGTPGTPLTRPEGESGADQLDTVD
ncbi:dormancy-associated protein homolog 4-like isoform X2 [Carya illinoinensis]|uniref:dormancy-associated protein homolog 4-like isoform X2 n=1 Tax=Carya illinoinensis TaxID=32201 RepID=UPI001C725BC4|nr:dormancy-associated protein homolog 4-like isoform X2 [Carya illinoinensis]